MQTPFTNVWPDGHTHPEPFQYAPPEHVCTGVVQTPFTNSCPDGQTHADPFQYEPPVHVGGGGGDVPQDEQRHEGLTVPS